jgi:putative ABC transport system permease protein
VVTAVPARARGLSALDRKLLRDLWSARGQAIAIALVVAAGIAIFVAMLSTFDSLDLSLNTYYDRYRFADVFVSLTRAPLSLEADIRAIPGVSAAETRVVADVALDVPGMSDPATGRLISIPADRPPALCDVFLRAGRRIDPGHPDEVLVTESFARAHALRPGDRVGAIINGRRRELQIVGLALSPEYIYPIRPGELMPDEARFGVFWMERRALASAFQMEGGFNNVVVQLMHGASEQDVIARLDRLVGSAYGSTGAIPRALQSSNWYLQNELTQLRASGAIVPVIFLGVAAFLLNVVLSRIVSVQRTQIAAIKALGYGNGAIALHYVKWSLVVAAVGAAAGVALGAWLGWALTRLYTSFFHFPVLLYRLDPQVAVLGAGIGVAAAVLGRWRPCGGPWPCRPPRRCGRRRRPSLARAGPRGSASAGSSRSRPGSSSGRCSGTRRGWRSPPSASRSARRCSWWATSRWTRWTRSRRSSSRWPSVSTSWWRSSSPRPPRRSTTCAACPASCRWSRSAPSR